MDRPIGFQAELEHIINRYSMENGSNTPDRILALYLRNCLDAYDAAVNARDRWYGVALRPGMQPLAAGTENA